MALDSAFRGKIGHGFERGNVLWTTVRVATVVKRVDSDENVQGTKDFRPSNSVGEEDCISRWDVREGNVGPYFIRRCMFGNRKGGVRQRTASEAPKIQMDYNVLRDSEYLCNPLGFLKFDRMTLTITKADGIWLKPLRFTNSKAGRRIKATTEQDNGSLAGS